MSLSLSNCNGIDFDIRGIHGIVSVSVTLTAHLQLRVPGVGGGVTAADARGAGADDAPRGGAWD